MGTLKRKPLRSPQIAMVAAVNMTILSRAIECRSSALDVVYWRFLDWTVWSSSHSKRKGST